MMYDCRCLSHSGCMHYVHFCADIYIYILKNNCSSFDVIIVYVDKQKWQNIAVMPCNEPNKSLLKCKQESRVLVNGNIYNYIIISFQLY